jgi:GH15 family glucan-1,4-alpha-glucosidase
LALAGRVEEAERNLEQLSSLQNDVGLLSEEYDPVGRRLLGNFPQAFSHIGLLHSILTIAEAKAGR